MGIESREWLTEQYDQLIKLSNGKLEVRDFSRELLTNPENYNNPKDIFRGAGAGAGKTTEANLRMIIYFMDPKNKNKKWLALPGFQENLKENYIDQFEGLVKMLGLEGKLPFKYTVLVRKYGCRTLREQVTDFATNDVNVMFGLPQSFNNYINLLPSNIDQVIGDEVHNFWDASVVQKLLKHTKPKNKYLMTGSVTKFNARRDKYHMSHVSPQTLLEQGIISDPVIELAMTSLDLTEKDWSSLYGELKEGKAENISDNLKALDEIAREIILRGKPQWFKSIYDVHTNKKFINKPLRVFSRLRKAVIACHNIAMCDTFHEALGAAGARVTKSHSKTEEEYKNAMRDFKYTDKYDILVIVKQGRVGYDVTDLYNFIDFTFSRDIESIYQMMLRLRGEGNGKLFMKVCPAKFHYFYEKIMLAVMWFMKDKNYSTWDGDYNKVKVPVVIPGGPNTKNPTTPPGGGGGCGPTGPGGGGGSPKFKLHDIPLSFTNFVNYIDVKTDSALAVYAWWPLTDALRAEYPDMIPTSIDERWDIGFNALMQIKNETGTAAVSNSYITEDGFRLGAWCSRQRNEFRLKNLSQDRIDLLKSIKFVWDTSVDYDKVWNKMYKQLVKHINKYGNTSVIKNYKLANWCETQRGYFKTNELSQERIDALNDVNFAWDFFSSKWNVGYEELKKYISTYGHAYVPSSYTTDKGFKLGQWCSIQRKLSRPAPPSHAVKNRQGISPDRKKMLDDIGFLWHIDKGIRTNLLLPPGFGPKLKEPKLIKQKKVWGGSLVSPEGVVYENIPNLQEFIRQQDNKLNQSAMCKVNSGERKSYKGWTKYHPK